MHKKFVSLELDAHFLRQKNTRANFLMALMLLLFQYKYQINIDGTVAAYRMPYLLVGDAVVFKHDSQYYEHFYHDLQPMVHYIPYKKDLSDIKNKILWAKNNDEQVVLLFHFLLHFFCFLQSRFTTRNYLKCFCVCF